FDANAGRPLQRSPGRRHHLSRQPVHATALHVREELQKRLLTRREPAGLVRADEWSGRDFARRGPRAPGLIAPSSLPMTPPAAAPPPPYVFISYARHDDD